MKGQTHIKARRDIQGYGFKIKQETQQEDTEL